MLYLNDSLIYDKYVLFIHKYEYLCCTLKYYFILTSCIDHIILKSHKNSTQLVGNSRITDHLPLFVEIGTDKKL